MAENVRIREEMKVDLAASQCGESAVAGRRLAEPKEPVLERNRLQAAAESAIDLYWRTRLAVHETYAQMCYATDRFKSSLGEKARKAREEYPLQFLGLVGLAGIAAGISARLWSCRRHG